MNIKLFKTEEDYQVALKTTRNLRNSVSVDFFKRISADIETPDV
jgi:hypothetical protein